MKTCSRCKEIFETHRFPTGKSVCKTCKSKKETLRIAANRKEKRNKAYFIRYDARGNDKKRGFECSITLEYIEEKLQHGCLYCEEKDTSNLCIDRIDNTIGHTNENCVVACYRCNMLRRNMPYEAWLLIAAQMKDIRLEGLFGTWIGGIKGHIK